MKNNAAEILTNVEIKLENIDTLWNKKYRIADVCDDLSIFDWWNDYIGSSKLNQMKSFLKLAIKLGYDGYVCFKVGAHCCANGMWAYKKESTTGYSPDGDYIYRSFTPDYTCYEANINGKTYPAALNKEWNSVKTAKQLKDMLERI